MGLRVSEFARKGTGVRVPVISGRAARTDLQAHAMSDVEDDAGEPRNISAGTATDPVLGISVDVDAVFS
jgi:hypothetical protein